MLKKVKKVKASVEFIQTTNITELENLVVMLQNSPAGKRQKKKWKITKILAGDILAELAPIKACMLDPTVRRDLFKICIHTLKEHKTFRIALAQKPLVEVKACPLFSPPVLKASAT